MQAKPICCAAFNILFFVASVFMALHASALSLAPRQDMGVTVTMTSTNIQNATNRSAIAWEMRITAVKTNTSLQTTNNFTSIVPLVKHVMHLPVNCEGIFVEIHCGDADLESALQTLRRVGWLFEYSRMPILYRLHRVPPEKWRGLNPEEVRKAMSAKEASLTPEEIRDAMSSRDEL